MSENPRDARAIESRLHRDLAFDAAPRPGDEARLQRIVAGAVGGTLGLGAIWLAVRTSMRVQLAVIAVGTATVTASTAAWVSAPAKVEHARVRERAVAPDDGPTRSSTPTIAPATPPSLDAAPDVPTVAAIEPPPQRPSARPSAPAAEPSAAELLASASAARAAREFTRAMERYDALATRYPRSREAAVGCVAHGRLRLDRGDASTAARLFADCIADHPGSPVAEQALVGRAEALDALGKTDEATAAWAELRRRHPDTLHRRR